MSRDRSFADQVVGLLMPLGPVRARGMFGGFGIYHEDLMFGLIAYDRLYFKVDEETKARFREAGAKPFVYDGKGKPIEMSYWTAPDGTLADPEVLRPWAELGLAAAQRARSKKPKKKRRQR
jgi:DNA transformation protein